MVSNYEPIIILMADDDEEDCMLTKKALNKSHLVNDVRFVSDGEELLDYLYQRGKYQERGSAPVPDVILLDLNMPRMDGREALEAIRSDDKLKKLPVVILTTSQAPEDIDAMYAIGANSYITKPVDFNGLVKAMDSLAKYWFEIVKLPDQNE